MEDNNFFREYEKISKTLAGYESRLEQIEMAMAIDEALKLEHHLIVEAGTGVGKSLAYLLPLIKWVLNEESGYRKAVVSTYTKALQRQLVEKELPFLKDTIFNELCYALCLGSENYICLRRLDKAVSVGLFDEPDIHIKKLLSWVKRTTSGIRSEIDLPTLIWQRVCRESDTCHGKKCKQYNLCFYQKAKNKERMSHILVTNHHLFFANVASGWNVLPQFNACVFDEAHEIEDVASDYLGIEVSNTGLKYLLDSIISPTGKGLLSQFNWLSQQTTENIVKLVNLLRLQGELFFNELNQLIGDSSSRRIYQKAIIQDNITSSLSHLSAQLKRLKENAKEEEEQLDIYAHALRCDAFGQSLTCTLEQEIEDYVYWAERDGRRIRLVATPIDIAPILKERVFNVVCPTILSSATLTISGRFDYIKERLGLLDAHSLSLNSPFNYREQSLIYIPNDILDPNDRNFEDSLINRLRDILSIMMGRTLVLFTSYKLMKKAFEQIQLSGVKLLIQGEVDNYTLINEFRNDNNSVIFGTYTFWQGIDIPGDDLQCVIITKLPFAVPDEPIIQARMESLSASGKNPFYDYQVPQAAILLKQGFGRLIRTKNDKGVVAILDSRVITKGYGREFLKSLPDCKITNSLKDLGNFIIHMKD